jgi:hypothetical protein
MIRITYDTYLDCVKAGLAANPKSAETFAVCPNTACKDCPLKGMVNCEAFYYIDSKEHYPKLENEHPELLL